MGSAIAIVIALVIGVAVGRYTRSDDIFRSTQDLTVAATALEVIGQEVMTRSSGDWDVSRNIVREAVKKWREYLARTRVVVQAGDIGWGA
jgi:hypothetical protein